MQQKTMYNPEIYRKTIHLSSLWIPFVYHCLDYFQMLIIMVAITPCLIFWDTQRNSKGRNGKLIKKLNKIFHLDRILRPHEASGKLTGATLMMMSGLLCLMIFPKEVFIIAFTVLVVSDTCAYVVGKTYGKPNKTTGKSYVGSQAFAISSIVISLLLGSAYGLELLPLVIASLTAAYFEHCSNVIKIDDNFVVPITYSLAFIISAALL
jgi:dolichol kinase